MIEQAIVEDDADVVETLETIAALMRTGAGRISVLVYPELLEEAAAEISKLRSRLGEETGVTEW